MTKTISIFGATGSIGDSAFSLLSEHKQSYEIELISGHNNLDRLSQLAHKFRPKSIWISSEADISGHNWPAEVEILQGPNALKNATARPVDWALNAVIGAVGLPVSLGLAQNARTLALANKESLVAGGALLKSTCKLHNTALIPVDSEHSAIFQCLEGQDVQALERVILTASGGPFRLYTQEQMKNVSVEDALNHPVWSMGARITIDSASMFNKALEMVEARELFDLNPSQIDVLVHPESIIHSFVEFSDQGQLAQLALPDMRQAIAYALGYPQRMPIQAPKLDLAEIGSLTFETPDEMRFPALRLARATMEAGGVHGAALNASKEEALTAFMDHKIGFLDIAEICERVLESGDWNMSADSLSTIETADLTARTLAKKCISEWQ